MDDLMSVEEKSKKRRASRSPSPEPHPPKKIAKKQKIEEVEPETESDIVFLPETGWLPNVSSDERLQWVPIVDIFQETPLHGDIVTKLKKDQDECKVTKDDSKLKYVGPDGTTYLKINRIPGIGSWDLRKLASTYCSDWLQVRCEPVFSKEGDSVEKFHLEVLIHVIKFEEAVQNNDFKTLKKGPYSQTIKSFLFQRIEKHLENVLKKFQSHKYCDAKTPATEAIQIKQPETIKTKLFEYQLDAISWMKYIEQQTANEVSYCSLVSWSSLKTEILFDMETSMYKTEKDIEEYKKTIAFKGGVIADEMGLGKTLQVIAMVLAEPATEKEKKKEVEMKNGRYVSRATLVHCPNHLAKQWKEEISKNTTGTAALCCTINEFDKLTTQSICNDYDFIIVSFQFVKNKSYEKFLVSSKAPVIGRKRKGADSSSSSSEEKKPVKTTAAKKTAAKKTAAKKKGKEPSDDDEMSEEETNTKTKSKKKVTKKQAETKSKIPKQVSLHQFHWKRIVLDEGHELVHGQEPIRYSTPPRFKDVDVPILDFVSDYRWYVTGTPFPNDEVIIGAMKFLIPSLMKSDEIHNGIEYYSNWVIFDLLLNNYYWRNTKESINQDEYNLPPFKNEIILMDFHPIEKALYEDCVGEPALQLKVCSNSLYDGSASGKYEIEQMFNCLEDARRKMSQRRKETLPGIIESEKTAKRIYESKASKTWTDTGKTIVDQALARWKAATAKRIAAEKQVAVWGKVKPAPIPKAISEGGDDEAMKDSSQSAGDDNGEESHGIDKICADRDLLRAELKKLGKPSGGSLYTMKARYIQALAQKAKQDEKQRDKDIKSGVAIKHYATENDRILRYGTKTTKLLSYLKELWERMPEAKVIVFSKYPIMLREINELLAGEGVPSVTVQGNIFCRNKAIVAFSKGCSVILLGLGTAASGTNLTAATHVILVDPMSGSPKEVRAAEAQAIARAHRRGQEKVVTIARFIVRDTIELTTFIQVYGTDDLPKEVKEDEKVVEQIIETTTPAKPMMIRTNSLSTLALSRSGGLKRTTSLADLLANQMSEGKEIL